VRTSGDPAAMLGVVRREVQSFDRNMPVTQIRTVEDVLLQALWAPRVGAGLLSVFALLALILASVGLYGIMSYSVSQRTGEIGVRMALGARPADLMRMLLRQVMLLAAPGVAAGILIGMALARSITSLLYGVSAFDPLILTATAAAVLAVALLASVFPARRAMQVDPIIALRQE
jgi:ABC-type antimicrobial peptide transport system permease subunit